MNPSLLLHLQKKSPDHTVFYGRQANESDLAASMSDEFWTGQEWLPVTHAKYYGNRIYRKCLVEADTEGIGGMRFDHSNPVIRTIERMAQPSIQSMLQAKVNAEGDIRERIEEDRILQRAAARSQLPPAPNWIMCTERLPNPTNQAYLVQLSNATWTTQTGEQICAMNTKVNLDANRLTAVAWLEGVTKPKIKPTWESELANRLCNSGAPMMSAEQGLRYWYEAGWSDHLRSSLEYDNAPV